MPPPLNIDDVVLARVNSNDGKSKVFNVLHYRLNNVTVSSGTPPTTFPDAVPILQKLGETLGLTIQEPWAACSSETMTLEGVSCQRVYNGARSELVTVDMEFPTEGEIVGDMLPTQDCLTILKRTGNGERWGLGRYYHSGIPESSQAIGIVSGTYKALVQALGNVLKETISITHEGATLFFEPVLHSVDAPEVGPPFVRTTKITNMVVSDDVIKTQRRRRPGKGI